MAYKLLADNVSGDLTTEGVALTSSQVEIFATGTFTSIKFEDSKYDFDSWCPVLDSSSGDEIELTEKTNELELISATNTGRKIRAVIVGATDVTIGIDEGI